MANNKVGFISLLCAAAGTCALTAAIHAGILTGSFWRLLLAGFTAGTVGGVADWFAVHALFHKITLPVVGRHTNLIAIKRKELTDGVADLVANNWLSTARIQEWIGNISITNYLFVFLANKENNAKAKKFAGQVFHEIISRLDIAEAVSFIQPLLKGYFSNANAGKLAGKWLQSLAAEGQHSKIFDYLLGILDGIAKHSDTREALLKLVIQKTTEFKEQSLLKRIALNVAATFGITDETAITDKLIDTINEFIVAARADPSHPARKKFESAFAAFADSMASGRNDAVNIVNDMFQRLASDPDTTQFFAQLLQYIQQAILATGGNPGSPLEDFIGRSIDKLVLRVQNDLVLYQKLDSRLKEAVTIIINHIQPELSRIVIASLGKLDDKELAQQIEDRVGNDLQYIRLNGAIVGGITGMCIHAIQSFLI